MSIDAPKQLQADVRPAYPDLPVPSTPLEYRVGPHPKKDYLIWKSPPTRQLSREKRREFQCDVSERFYDDYIGTRTTGDARNDVLTGLSKLHFQPELYRLNAAQTFAYDPARPVPRHVDLNQMVRNETTRERERLRTQARQRRLSAPELMQSSAQYYVPQQYLDSSIPQLPEVKVPRKQQQVLRPSEQKLLDESVRADMVPAVENWMASASAKDRETATNFLRTISSQGQRPVDPASKAAVHKSRVRSAVVTPSRAQRQHQQLSVEFKQMERDMAGHPREQRARREAPRRKVKRSLSETPGTQGMFSPLRQQPAHFTIHPEWASETLNKH